MHNFLQNNKFNITLRQAQGPYESAHGVRGNNILHSQQFILPLHKQTNGRSSSEVITS